MTRRIALTGSDLDDTPMLPGPGDVLGEKYRVQRRLDIGGMGAVFEVTHCVTAKRFAIKWLLATKPDTQEAQQNVRRFVREAQLAGRIEHPNVIQVYDIYQTASSMFLVMELLEGESLAAYLRREGPMPVLEACRVMIASMEGIDAAHAAGVVHRDIKPANIFLCKPRSPEELPQPKVLDFGISRLMRTPDLSDETTTRSGAIIGTPYYMAPEQMRTGIVDERVDVYALGVSLYELLGGKRPYDSVSYADLVLKIALGEALPLTIAAPTVPAELSAIVMRAMHVDPAQRFETVRELMEALRAVAADHVEKSEPCGPTPPRRHWSLYALAVAAGLMLAGLAVWGSVGGARIFERQDTTGERPEHVLRPREPNRAAPMIEDDVRAATEPIEPNSSPSEVPYGATPTVAPNADPVRPAQDIAAAASPPAHKPQLSRPAPKPKPAQPTAGQHAAPSPERSRATANDQSPTAPVQRPVLRLERDGF